MKDFNDIIKDKLYNYQKTPPMEVFDAVKARYPKKSFFETHKLAMITTLSLSLVLIVVALTFFLLNNENTNQDTPNTKQITYIDNNSNQIINNDNNNNDNNKNEILVNNTVADKNINIENNIEAIISNNPKTTIITKDVFKFNDTTICGLSLETNFNYDAKNLLLPQGLKILSKGNKYNIVADKEGSYLLKYREKKKNDIYIDSVWVEYHKISFPTFHLSSEKICNDENLIITVDNPHNYKLQLLFDGADLIKRSNSYFEFANMKQGKYNYSLRLVGEACSISKDFEVEVFGKPNYFVKQKADYCSGTNGEIAINFSKYTPDYYMLDDEFVNKTGFFDKVHSGIHTISIKYNDLCYYNDTIFVYDSLKLKPYFKSEKSLIDKSTYSFNNFTEIDDEGFEKNKDVEFLWTINDELVSSTDNLLHLFDKSGKYNVKLTAKINDECYRNYSEDIIISSNDLNIPNVFTPNGDGVGDYFEIRYDGSLLDYNIKIMGQSGEVIFESNDIVNSWDGKISGNNDAKIGVYYYVVILTESDGNKKTYTGNVQLLR